jgi:hypothetical protein
MATWQDKLKTYSTDQNAAQQEVLRAKSVYAQEQAAGANKDRLNQINHWANQVRGAAGLDNNKYGAGVTLQQASQQPKQPTRPTFSPPQANTLSWGDATGRVQQQLDPLFQRAVKNVMAQKYKNELNAGELASKRGLAHSGLAADLQNKVALQTQSDVSGLEAEKASRVAQMAQALINKQEDDALRLRQQAFQEYLGQSNLGLQYDQFDYGKEQDQRSWDWKSDERDYGRGQDQKAWDWKTDEREYGRGQDQKSWEWKEKEFNQNVKQFGLQHALSKYSAEQNAAQGWASNSLSKERFGLEKEKFEYDKNNPSSSGGNDEGITTYNDFLADLPNLQSRQEGMEYINFLNPDPKTRQQMIKDLNSQFKDD